MRSRILSTTLAGLTCAAALGGLVATSGAGQTTTTTTTKTTQHPTGQMTVVSQEKRTFRVGDTDVVYTAPESVDLSTLDGSSVRVEVEPTGEVTRVTRIEKTETIE